MFEWGVGGGGGWWERKRMTKRRWGRKRKRKLPLDEFLNFIPIIPLICK